MPFTYRDKPKLVDRLRGKSGEEILNELKSDLDSQGRRMFFDSPWRTRHSNSAFPRGFPFDDDRNRINIRSYLDDIAARHPEFAEQLIDRPWNEDFPEAGFKKTEPQSCMGNQAGGSSQKSFVGKDSSQGLTNFGLRNTVPLGPGANPEGNRHQRSMSAPPENRGASKGKRFVTKCEIPVMSNPTQEPVQAKPDQMGRGPQEQTQQKGNNAPNVRVIPIQVEGRDTPLVNTNIDFSPNFGGETFTEPVFEGRLPRDFGTYQRHSPRFDLKDRAPTPPHYQYAPQYQQYVPPSQHFMPQQHQQSQFMPQQHFAPSDHQAFAQQHSQKPPAPPPQQQQQQQPPPPPQQQHQQQQQHGTKLPQGDETDSRPPPQPKPEPVKDPIEKVQAIQKEVEELMRQVEAFKGNSRTDKQYLTLDELLTRQLLLLDVIDTEGKENVRQARKDTIRSIQRCISTLENKVPLAEGNEPTSESNVSQEDGNNASKAPQPMDLDATKENTPVENKDSQKMEVENQGNSDTQQEKQQQLQQEQQPSQQPEQQGQAKEEITGKI